MAKQEKPSVNTWQGVEQSIVIAKRMLSDIEKVVEELTKFENWGFDSQTLERSESLEEAFSCHEIAQRIAMLIRQTELNENTMQLMMNLESDKVNYETKKQIARSYNEELRRLNASIAHPETGEPCNLFAVASPDGKGRYVLENKLTKKRSHTTESLRSLLPIRLTTTGPRKEGTIDRRKKKPEQR